ncbi:CGNR zinc finger domain-containing protein [Streptomyces sp. NPDC001205]
MSDTQTSPQDRAAADRRGQGRDQDTVGPSFVGGHPVLDFVNTEAWRLDGTRRAERVTEGFSGWLDWAARAGLFGADEAAKLRAAADAADGGATERELAALRALRDCLGALLDALTQGQELPGAAWEALRKALLRAREAADLPPSLPLRWDPRAERTADLRHALALRAEELLVGPELSRVRRCAGPGCGWFFLDRTRGGTRRWCSSGDCGNRDRARRHYARTRQAAS